MHPQLTYKNTNFTTSKRLENTVIFHSASSGKEKDSETGYHYFGARYYNSDLSLWLSVDPMSDKYPNLSPYNYCAWNPMKLVDPDGEQIRPTLRYPAYNRPQRHVQSNSQRTVYRSSSRAVTSYSRTGRSNITHAVRPVYLRQQKSHGIVSQYNELYGKRWVEQAAKYVDNNMEFISKIIENKKYSVVKTENRIYTDKENSVSANSYIQFDNPEAQEKFDEALSLWSASYNKIREEHTVVLPNGFSSLDYEGLEAMTVLGKSPIDRVLKKSTKLKTTERTTFQIPTIQTQSNQ